MQNSIEFYQWFLNKRKLMNNQEWVKIYVNMDNGIMIRIWLFRIVHCLRNHAERKRWTEQAPVLKCINNRVGWLAVFFLLFFLDNRCMDIYIRQNSRPHHLPYVVPRCECNFCCLFFIQFLELIKCWCDSWQIEKFEQIIIIIIIQSFAKQKNRKGF